MSLAPAPVLGKENPGIPAQTAVDHGPARLAASTFFLLDGVAFGTWAALIPTFKQHFGVTDAELSQPLLGMVAGSVISMPLAGHLIALFGSQRVAVVGAVAVCFVLPLLALAPSFGAFIAVASLFGAFKGALDVSVNVQAITVENAVRRSINASFQALWSLGGLIAAFLASLCIKHGISSIVLTTSVATALLLCVALGSRRLMPDPALERKHSARFQWPNPTLRWLGVLAFMALFAEGVMMDWGAVYARGVAGASESLAPLAYAVFCFSMASGRLIGDWVIRKMTSIRVLRLTGLLMMAGLSIIIFIPFWPATFAGLFVAGLAISNWVPILFVAAGRAHESGAGPGMATVTTIGYFGFLAGPPLIGVLSAAAGLPRALMVVLIFGAIISTFGVTVLRRQLPT
ncbi:MAG TPA: MFS transporter [Chthoniobacterales bacterium]